MLEAIVLCESIAGQRLSYEIVDGARAAEFGLDVIGRLETG